MGRVLLIIWDGFRPDLLREDLTPALHALAAGGVRATHQHAVFPTCTTSNLASLVTGSLPAHHGLPANSLFAPEVDPVAPLSLLTFGPIERLTRSRTRLIQPVTLIERLVAAGRRAVVLASDEAGYATVLDSSRAAAFFDFARAWPARMEEHVRATGRIPARAAPNLSRMEFMTELLLRLWQDERPDLGIVLYEEPDASQHASGLGSPRSLTMVRAVDGLLARLVSSLGAETNSGTNILVLSDHGASTIAWKVSLAETLRQAGLSHGTGRVVVAPSGGTDLLWVPDPLSRREVIAFLQQQPWTGALFGADNVEGVFPMAEAGLGAEAGDLALAFAWDGTEGAGSVQGRTAADTGYAINAAAHGGLSPFEVHALLVAAGPNFKKGEVSEAPSGIVDIAPTVAAILGVEIGPRDGRVLHELLSRGPDPRAIAPQATLLRRSARSREGLFAQELETIAVGPARYLCRGVRTV